jgi:hypothetical protein
MVGYSHNGMVPSPSKRDSESLWLWGTWSRPYQSFWELCVLVGTGLMNLVLGKFFYCCKVGTLELCTAQIGILELCVHHTPAWRDGGHIFSVPSRIPVRAPPRVQSG